MVGNERDLFIDLCRVHKPFNKHYYVTHTAHDKTRLVTTRHNVQHALRPLRYVI